MNHTETILGIACGIVVLCGGIIAWQGKRSVEKIDLISDIVAAFKLDIQAPMVRMETNLAHCVSELATMRTRLHTQTDQAQIRLNEWTAWRTETDACYTNLEVRVSLLEDPAGPHRRRQRRRVEDA